MQNVVFTGPAFDSTGASVVRAALIAACKKIDMNVQSSVRSDTNMVVASRLDTVKAKSAASRGLPVVTFPEFIALFLGAVEMERGAVPNKYTDSAIQDMLVPVFVKSSQLEAIDVL